jgi:hypothetical protein
MCFLGFHDWVVLKTYCIKESNYRVVLDRVCVRCGKKDLRVQKAVEREVEEARKRSLRLQKAQEIYESDE